ncbi:hypothetical protein I4U23_008655 [Adineta vaga]|nr:hypothetical protein I4U23_008655 [Adineta vaga]
MSTEKVLCCFKNLTIDRNGSTILARNLNNLLNTTTFDILEKHGSNNSTCELECTRDEVDFIQRHLGELVTRDHRSIWFTYKAKPTDEPSENNRNYFPRPLPHKSWTALYNFGAMLSYDIFIDHIKNNRSPVSIKIDRDIRGRPKSLILQTKHTEYRMIFDFNSFHTDILVKYGEEKKNESVQIVFMLQGLPEIQRKSNDGSYISSIKSFVINYADFQNVPSSHYNQLQSPRFNTHASSDLAHYAIEMLRSLGYLFLDKYLIYEKFQHILNLDREQSPKDFYELCFKLWDKLKKNHCYSLEDIFNDDDKSNRKLSKTRYQIPHFIITPLRNLIQPMHETIGHRAMRQYTSEKGFQWMLVYIRDEDGLKKINDINNNRELRERYKNLLQEGICLGSYSFEQLTYYYFGSSGSQMKKQEFWFMSPVNESATNAASKVNEARTILGDLKKIRNVATYIARVGLYLSSSKSTDIQLKYNDEPCWWQFLLNNFAPKWVKFSSDQTKYPAHLIEDIECNGYCFTDGVGLISLGLARKVATSIGIRFNFLCRNRIPLPVDEARYLFGIADETNSLKEGQCFIQYQKMNRKTYEVVTGEVLVTKNPCLYPGDIRRLQAVDIPALRPFIRDCIVFPVRGSRPHSNEISGSDLDGDQYWVYWGKDLTINEIIPPLSYTPATKKTVPSVTPDVIVNHILDTMDNQTTGIISNTHSVIADRAVDGTKSTDCKFLADVFARAIDSIKTGEEIHMKKVLELREKWCKEYPSWMMKNNKPKYKSESINGYLFEKVQNLRIEGRAYKNIHKKYDRINAETRIDMERENGNDDTNEQRSLIYITRFISNTLHRMSRIHFHRQFLFLKLSLAFLLIFIFVLYSLIE